MSTSKCKAKNPSTCRYHSKFSYEGYLSSLKHLTPHLQQAKDMKQYQDLSEHLERSRLLADANEYGFRKLNKEFKKALRGKDVELQANLAKRLKAATEERLKDGKEGEWEAANGSYFVFGSKVLEKAEKQDTVKIPISLTGSTHILSLYGRALNEGYTVKDVLSNPYSYKNEDYAEERHQAVVKGLQENADLLKEGQYGTVYDEVLKKNQMLLRGIILSKDGRDIKVKGMNSKEQRKYDALED